MTLNAEQSARLVALGAAARDVWGAGQLTYLAEWILNGSPDEDDQKEPADIGPHVTGLSMPAEPVLAVTGETSDGSHTFNELYRHRMLLSAALWYFLARAHEEEFEVHKSRLHSDGTMLMSDDGTEWFIVVAQLPTGQVSYHYPLKDWDLFWIPTRHRAAEWDGHTPGMAADRLEEYLRNR